MRKGSLSRVLAVILCITMLFGFTVSATGCNVINLNVSASQISETELARLIVNAIVSDKNVADCYAKIPASQLDGLSYSFFSEYCSILRKCSQEHGTPDSFRILNDEDKAEYFKSIDEGTGENYKSVSTYGNLDVVELSYSQDNKPLASPVRFVIAKSDDKYVMATKYISDSLLAYSYINHYFDMIDENNIDGIEALIKPTYDADIYMNSVISAKATYIADYYRLKVKSGLSDYNLKVFSPTHVVYEIPEVFTSDSKSIFSKNVDLYLQNDGSYFINDDVPVIISEIRFYANGDKNLRMGSTYTRDEIYQLVGYPIITSYERDAVILTYTGLTIRLETDEGAMNTWTSGTLSSVVIRNDELYSVGQDLYIGMNVSELLLIYPMFDKSDYTSSFKNGDGEFVLSFQFDEFGNVTRIRLGENLG